MDSADNRRWPAAEVKILQALADAFDLSPDREVTLEANPESVTVERLAAYRAAGATADTVRGVLARVQATRDRLVRLAEGGAAVREASRRGCSASGTDPNRRLSIRRQ